MKPINSQQEIKLSSIQNQREGRQSFADCLPATIQINAFKFWQNIFLLMLVLLLFIIMASCSKIYFNMPTTNYSEDDTDFAFQDELDIVASSEQETNKSKYSNRLVQEAYTEAVNPDIALQDVLVIVASGEVEINENIYTVCLVQDEYMKPLNPDVDEGFCMYEHGFRGKFSIVVYNNKNIQVCRLSHDEIFISKIAGFGGKFAIRFDNYSGEEIISFMIGAHDLDDINHSFANNVSRIIQIDEFGQLVILPAYGYKTDGFVYTASPDNYATLIGGHETGFFVMIRGEEKWLPGKYVWDGEKFNFGDLSYSEWEGF